MMPAGGEGIVDRAQDFVTIVGIVANKGPQEVASLAGVAAPHLKNPQAILIERAARISLVDHIAILKATGVIAPQRDAKVRAESKISTIAKIDVIVYSVESVGAIDIALTVIGEGRPEVGPVVIPATLVQGVSGKGVVGYQPTVEVYLGGEAMSPAQRDQDRA